MARLLASFRHAITPQAGLELPSKDFDGQVNAP
jgi:hypothetical protein